MADQELHTQIKVLVDPTLDEHVATKKYVDDHGPTGAAMAEPLDDGLIYGRSRATGATGGTWEEIRGGGIAVGPTAPSPASQDDVWLSTAGLGLWSYATGPGWVQRVSSGTQGATGATGATGAAEGITIASATNPATASPGDLWTTPSGGLYIYTVVPGGWWPII